MSEDRESRFEPGEVVRLKSGGPAMTVVSGDDPLLCMWFAVDAVSEQRFPPAVLERVIPPRHGEADAR